MSKALTISKEKTQECLNLVSSGKVLSVALKDINQITKKEKDRKGDNYFVLAIATSLLSTAAMALAKIIAFDVALISFGVSLPLSLFIVAIIFHHKPLTETAFLSLLNEQEKDEFIKTNTRNEFKNKLSENYKNDPDGFITENFGYSDETLYHYVDYRVKKHGLNYLLALSDPQSEEHSAVKSKLPKLSIKV